MTSEKLKARFNWEIFAKHDKLCLSDISLELLLMQVVFKNQCTPYINAVFSLVLVSTIVITANIVVPPGDNMYSYYRHTAIINCCAPGLGYCALEIKCLDILVRNPA